MVTMMFPKLIWVKIIESIGTEQKKQKEIYCKLLGLNKQLYAELQKVKPYFRDHWRRWFHSDRYDNANFALRPTNIYRCMTYQGYHIGYYDGIYMEFSRTDENGEWVLTKRGKHFQDKKDGDWIIYHYGSHVPKKKSHFTCGVETGVQKKYDYRGELVKRQEYDAQGRKTGEQRKINVNTGMITITNYKNGKKHGLHTIRNPCFKHDTLRCTYGNDLLEGQYIRRWDNKKIRQKSNHYRGLLHGLFEKYHEHGKIHVRRTYENGKINGLTKTWWSNGKLSESIEMKNDVPHGTVITFYQDGDPKYNGKFKDGKEIGLHRKYNIGGVVVETNYG
jgi:antitoxin component YwqK of YwqJK toxin-antitoxin module